MEFDEVGGWPGILATLAARRDLAAAQARAAMAEILEGAATPAQIAGFIVALRMKGETVDELGGLVDAMLAAAERVTLPPGEPGDPGVVDVVGTGGDRAHTINVSTLAALVVAGGGGRVCKHGNRAASSATGSADLLEALGVRIDCGPGEVARCVAEAGIGFCFATRFHPAMRHAGPPRRELGIATSFNFLGPLANPAGVRRFMIGVADPSMAERMVGVLAARGSERVLVVHGGDGLDELTITTTSQVIELRDGEVRDYEVDPKELGITPAPAEALVGGDPATNAELTRRILAGEAGPHRDIVCLNAGAGMVAAGMVDDLADGVEAARSAIDDGGAAAALDRLVAVSNAPPPLGVD
ncbi:MAG TPA: anthranilate phosphoribosyltransferase [Acidimicrobiales bacterium]|jgi:anthranilate phosphoribosyltransferase|nr:anthranilate phosphoribosyltransferase [Acidimicrobiales bacterium]